MQYKLTKQIAHSESVILFAEFSYLADAELFIEKLKARDDESKIDVLYAITACAETVTDPFNVIKRNAENTEILVARFSILTDARLFLAAKLLADESGSIDETYYLLDGDKFIDKYNQETLTLANTKSQKPKHAIRPVFPTPKLKPRGSATGLYRDEDEEDD